MKKQEKILICILVIVVVILIAIFFGIKRNKKENKANTQIEENNAVEEFVKILENGTKLNTSKKLNETKDVNGFKFDNIQFTEQNGLTVLLADVTNNTGKETNITLVDVILLDREGNEIVTVQGIISPLKIGETTQFNTSMTLDYTDAYDLKIIIK